jgi:hypothetical protein
MFTRQFFRVIVSLTLLQSFYSSETAELVSTAAAMTNLQESKAQAQEKEELKELMNQIRRDKFDLILPQIMREYEIDMWIQVMREGNPDPIGADLGSNSGVFIFTDRRDRIERAVFGQSSDAPRQFTLVRESGAYDIVAKDFPLVDHPSERELPGGPETELDHRFDGVGEFVAERDPKRIGVNYLEKLGPRVEHEVPRLRSEGIWHTDYNLLVKAIGDKYAKRIVSAEYLKIEYLARGVKSELELYRKIRTMMIESLERDLSQIVPGVTKLKDFEGDVSVMDMDGNRNGREDYVIQRGNLIVLDYGLEDSFYNSLSFTRYKEWKFGNFYDTYRAYAYVLREGETKLPPKINRAWADAVKVRNVLEDNVKVGRTGGETLEILKQKIDQAGFIYVNRQRYNKDLDPETTQVPIDLHAMGKGPNAPRIAPLGPDWQRELTLPLYHHFVMEYWVYVPMPEWGEGRYLNIGFHDGAFLTERGVEYSSPPPVEIRLIDKDS